MPDGDPINDEPIDSLPPKPVDDAALEVRFLQQEHRIFTILGNLRRHRNGPLRAAVMRSLRGWLLSFFLSGGVIAGSAGLALTVFTLAEMRDQTAQMALQTTAIAEQNQHFARQVKIEAEQDYQTRKASLLSIIYDTEQRWPWSEETPRSSERARCEAAVSLVRLVNESDRSGGRNAPGEGGGTLTERNRVNLSGASLSGALLGGAALVGARLQRADLSKAVLTEASLSSASLVNADLREANLFEADLRYATLWLADLRAASFSQADLRRAWLVGADLRGAHLIRANMRWANLAGADLTGANLLGADLMFASFTSTTIWPKSFDPGDPAHGLQYRSGGSEIRSGPSTRGPSGKARAGEEFMPLNLVDETEPRAAAGP